MKNDKTLGLRSLYSNLGYAFLFALLLSAPGKAQEKPPVCLQLIVVDAQRAPVPGATVILIREGTNEENPTGVTRSDGSLNFANLKPGTIEVRISANGFSSLTQNVALSENLNSSFTFSLAASPTEPTSVEARTLLGTGTKANNKHSQSCLDLQCKIRALRLSRPLQFARGLQYEYKLIEQPGTVLIDSGSGVGEVTAFLRNPQHYLQQHTMSFKFSELFDDRLSLFKRGSDYLKDYPAATYDDLKKPLSCAHGPLITCLTKGGSWWQRALMGTSINISLSQRADIQQGIFVTDRRFGKGFQVNGGFTFDPAKLFPTATDWRNTFEDIKKIDPGLAALEVSDARDNDHAPWNPSWVAAFIPKVEFKILSQFDFVKDNGVLVQAPFQNRSLNTWTFSWDLTRVIPDVKRRIDDDAIREALANLGRKLQAPPKKRCTLHFRNGDKREFDVGSGFRAEQCQALVKVFEAEKYELSCVLDDGTGKSVTDTGGPTEGSKHSVKPPQNCCQW